MGRGGAGSPEATAVTDERAPALRRLLFIGGLAWASFALMDVLGTSMWHDARTMPALLSLRLTGMLLIGAGYAVLRWGRPLSPVTLDLLDVGACAVIGLLGSIMGVLYGGVASRDFADIMLMVCFRATLVPAPWTRTSVSVAAFALSWPAANIGAAFFSPEVRAQWASTQVVGDFVLGMMFIALAGVMCTAASHDIWRARQQATVERRLGSYRLKVRIGSGTSGDVWIARQEPLGRDVALKMLKDRGGVTLERARRFEREAKAAAALQHANTVRIFEYGASADGVLYIAMELLEGMDLDALVEFTGPMPPARAVRLILQACGSLSEAHAAGIVHRDIKPANLFITRIGHEYDCLKLLDFGVARLVDAEDSAPSLTAAGTVFGTPAYMAPEVCAGERATIASDVYSLGVVFYFMLTGSQLFPGKSVGETVMSHISRQPQRPTERLGTPLPPVVEEAVMRCLVKDASKRFQSARDLAEALAKWDQKESWTQNDARNWWNTSRAGALFRARG